MIRAYVTKGRLIYYAAIAIIGLAVQTAATPNIGQHGTKAALVMMMWLLLVVDTKIVPSTISLSRPFLPGIGWIDLAVAMAIYGGLAFIAYRTDRAAETPEFIVTFLCAIAICFVAGVLGLLRWQRWRRLR